MIEDLSIPDKTGYKNDFQNSALARFIDKLKYEDLTEIDNQCIENCLISNQNYKVWMIFKYSPLLYNIKYLQIWKITRAQMSIF